MFTQKVQPICKLEKIRPKRQTDLLKRKAENDETEMELEKVGLRISVGDQTSWQRPTSVQRSEAKKLKQKIVLISVERFSLHRVLCFLVCSIWCHYYLFSV